MELKTLFNFMLTTVNHDDIAVVLMTQNYYHVCSINFMMTIPLLKIQKKDKKETVKIDIYESLFGSKFCSSFVNTSGAAFTIFAALFPPQGVKKAEVAFLTILLCCCHPKKFSVYEGPTVRTLAVYAHYFYATLNLRR